MNKEKELTLTEEQIKVDRGNLPLNSSYLNADNDGTDGTDTDGTDGADTDGTDSSDADGEDKRM